jgi:hypothetical protein
MGVGLVLSMCSEVMSCLCRNIHLVVVQRYVAMQARPNFTTHRQDKIGKDRKLGGLGLGLHLGLGLGLQLGVRVRVRD